VFAAVEGDQAEAQELRLDEDCRPTPMPAIEVPTSGPTPGPVWPGTSPCVLASVAR
jgi:hypothetical protein